MKVSIVFPVYNKGPHLERSISSAFTQTYTDLEIIAVDDGSTDDSLAVLQSLASADRRLKILTQDNGGPSAARNTGLAAATGEYIMFHDADDTLSPEAIAQLVGVAKETKSDIVSGISRRKVAEKEWTVTRFEATDLAMDFRTSPQHAFKYCTNFSPCNKFFSLDFLQRNELQFTPRLYMQDIEFWLKAMVLSRNASQTPHVISTYHFIEDGTSRQRTPARFDSLFRLFDNLEAFLARHDLRSFQRLCNIALLQGAFMFFARWKLDEWRESGNAAELERLSALLARIPESDFLKFFVHFNRNANAAVLLLVRSGHFEAAYQAEQAFNSSVSAASRLAKRILRVLPGSTVRPGSLKYLAKNAANASRHFSIAATVMEGPNRQGAGVSLGLARGIARATRTTTRFGKESFARLGRVAVGGLLRTSRMSARLSAPLRSVAAIGHSDQKRLLVFGLGNLYSIGGVQLSYKHLFEHLCSKGISISFYTHHEPPADRPDAKPYYPFPEGVTVKQYYLDDNWLSQEKIAHAVEMENPDAVLIVNSGQPALVLASALYDLQVPVVYSERGGADHCLEHNWASKTQRSLTHFATDFSHVLMPSYIKAAPDWLQTYVTVIPSLTEPSDRHASPETPGPNGRSTILYTGRLSFEKDIDKLIKAFGTLAKQYPAWDIELFGDGPDRQALETLARQLGVVDRVFFRGNSSSYAVLSDAYCRSNVFVLPSRAEGCPLSLREAMAHGLPVIGYEDCSGTNDIIVSGRNGFLAGAADKVRSLAGALETLMKDPDLRREFGRAGIEDVVQYAPERTLNAWEGLLRKAMDLKGRRHHLRREKEAVNPAEYQWLKRLLDATREQRVTRNIFAYDSGVRRTGADAGHLRDYVLVYGSCLFDPAAYAKRNVAVKLAGQDPLLHYVEGGWRTDSLPGGHFDPDWYIRERMNGDLSTCPLVHYYEKGRYEDLRPSETPQVTILRKLDRELKSDGGMDFDLSMATTGDVVQMLMDRLAWKRVDFQMLRSRYPLNVANQTRRNQKAIAR